MKNITMLNFLIVEINGHCNTLKEGRTHRDRKHIKQVLLIEVNTMFLVH